MEPSELQAAVVTLDPSHQVREKADRPAVAVTLECFLSTMKKLKEDPFFGFDMLCAHAAIDWPKEERIELVYQLYSTLNQHYLMISLSLPRANPVAPSVCSLWKIAEWQEREVYDLFGVLYSSHPDLRRVFLEDDWQGFPLRKDYQDDFILGRPW